MKAEIVGVALFRAPSKSAVPPCSSAESAASQHDYEENIKKTKNIYIYTYICMTSDQFDAYFFWLKQCLLPFFGGKTIQGKIIQKCILAFCQLPFGCFMFS